MVNPTYYFMFLWEHIWIQPSLAQSRLFFFFLLTVLSPELLFFFPPRMKVLCAKGNRKHRNTYTFTLFPFPIYPTKPNSYHKQFPDYSSCIGHLEIYRIKNIVSFLLPVSMKSRLQHCHVYYCYMYCF